MSECDIIIIDDSKCAVKTSFKEIFMAEIAKHGDYVPKADGDLLVFAQNYQTVFSSSAATACGFTADEVTALETAVTAYKTALDASVDRAHSAVVAKNNARKTLISIIRDYTSRIQAHPSTTDVQRAELRITIRAKTRSKIETPTTYPHIKIEILGYLKVRITFYFDSPESLSVPYGYHGAVLYFHIGDAPVTEFSMLNESCMMSASPYTMLLPQDADLKVISYTAAWEVSGGRQGPRAPIQSLQIR